MLIDTDAGVFHTKLRGAAQAPASLVAEIVVGALADALGLSVPAREGSTSHDGRYVTLDHR